MRKIPATMVSQHPDHASTPYWHSNPFIKVQDEVFEAFNSFFDLGVSEYKWDWEGKFVDESVVERLLSEHFEQFQKEQLGKHKFLTFRLPNPKVETEFRLGRAFMGILGAAGLAEKAQFEHPPLFEVILPMTESSEEMIQMQRAFLEIASLKHPLLKMTESSKLRHLELIPLFEQVEVIMDSDKIIEEYVAFFKEEFGQIPEYIRPYVARSDPALNSGLIPTVLAIKVALSHYAAYEKRTGIKMFPIIGSAALPFRGGLTPETVESCVNEYRGVRTALLQSAFRYDYDTAQVRKAIQQLEDLLPKQIPVSVSVAEEKEIRKIIPVFEKHYRQSVEGIADVINMVASKLPKRRERVQHVGLFGYSRGVGAVKLPRAIGFTAALYSIGAPPEFLGTGRGLAELAGDAKALKVLRKFYVNIESDLKRAAKYVNKENLKKLAAGDAAWNGVLEDIAGVEAFLGEQVGPQTADEKKHQTISSQIYIELEDGSISPELIEKAALLRKSLG